MIFDSKPEVYSGEDPGFCNPYFFLFSETILRKYVGGVTHICLNDAQALALSESLHEIKKYL